MFHRSFDFAMVSEEIGNSVVLRIPASSTQPANTGDLTLRLTVTPEQLEGELGGGGLSDDRQHTFYVWESGRRTGVARVTGRRTADGTLDGTFSGYVTFSVFQTAAGGECTAADHSWRAVLR
jgi:hypothetical protein